MEENHHHHHCHHHHGEHVGRPHSHDAEHGAEFFNEAAHEWDARPGMKEFAAKVFDGLQDRIALKEDMNVLDFGAGTGLLGIAIAEFVKEVTCSDVSQGMLDVINEKIRTNNLKNVKTLHLERPTDLQPCEFDLIVSSMALHHVAEIEETLKYLAKCLKPGGMLMIFDLEKSDHSHLFHPHHVHKKAHVVHTGGFSCQELRSLYEVAGLTDDFVCQVVTVKEKEVELVHGSGVKDETKMMKFGILGCSVRSKK